MFNFKEQLDKLIKEERIEIVEVVGDDKDRVVFQIQSVFIIGNPRALWMGFGYKATSIPFEGNYAYLKLPEVFTQKEDLYFLVDHLNKDFYLFKGQLSSIMILIGDSVGLNEYYLINTDISVLACETDHGDLLYIDIHKNERIHK